MHNTLSEIENRSLLQKMVLSSADLQQYHYDLFNRIAVVSFRIIMVSVVNTTVSLIIRLIAHKRTYKILIFKTSNDIEVLF